MTLGALFIEAILLQVFGTTLGKFLFGIHLKERVGFLVIVTRTFNVGLKGLALGLPFVGFFTAWIQYRHLVRKGHTTYDEKDRPFLQIKAMGPFVTR